MKFEVAIDDTVRLQVLEDKETGDIVLDHIEGLSLDLADDVEHLFAVNVLHDEVGKLLIAEGLDEADVKNGLLENILLLDDGLLRFLLADVLLGEALDGEEHSFLR